MKPESIAVEPNLETTNYGEDPDSAYGEEVASYTTTISSFITDYKFHNNRRYHAYKEGSYPYPNDEKESDRLDIMHKLTEVSLEGKLNLAPFSSEPQRILDIGTGTGIWAIEMGDKFPNAEILGNDLSPIQPRWSPPNVRFEVDDVEADWTYHAKFDFIHCRFMGNAIRDWPRLVSQCFEHTTPGGWVEFIDLDLEWRSPDGSLTSTSAAKHFNSIFMKASREIGQEPCPGPLLEGWLEDAGFKDVAAKRYVWPVGTWPIDKHLKDVGAWNFLQVMEGLEAFLYVILKRALGYSKEEIDVVCAKIRKEMKDPRIHAYFYLYVAYGRKP